MSLGQQYKDVLEQQSKTPQAELGWFMDPTRLENIYQWIIELHSFDANLPLASDLSAHHSQSVVLELLFGPEYPIAPPFVRIIRPRVRPVTTSDGGGVTSGGSVCLRSLTSSGWAPTTVSDVLQQVREVLCATGPLAQAGANWLGGTPGGDYVIDDAISSYQALAAVQGWAAPDLTVFEFKKLAD